ncbi:MAG: prolyl oligopeptidase family serine peptidase [Thermoanaerobaculia bacterium]
MVRKAALILLPILLLAALPALAATTHPFSVHDMLAMKRISEPQPAPDGSRIVFVLRTTDLDANRGRTDIWIVGSDGSAPRALTANPASDSTPIWSPDGKALYFLSTRSGSSQVWQLRFDGGEPAQVTNLPLDVSNLELSPDGSRIAFSLEVFPGASIDETVKRIADRDKQKTTGKIYDELLFRHWDAWSDMRRNHIFVMPVAGGPPVDIMRDMSADAPSRPFGGSEEFAFTPDGRSIVFTARDAGREEAWSTNFDLWVAPVDGSVKPRNLTDANDAWDSSPSFSPDGKTLAYIAMSRPGFEADRNRIIVRAWPEGAPRVLTDSWDRSAGTLEWSSDGREIYTSSDNLGQHSLFAINAATGTVRTVVLEGSVSSPSVMKTAKGDRIVYGLDTLKSPVEIFSVKPDGTDVRRITDINRAEVAAARMGDYEQFTFKGANGDTVYGYLVKPVDFDPAKKYPIAFLIHGGPQGSFGNHFHYRWNPQPYAGRGFAAVMIDFHGSTGYGQAFTDAIRHDWGGKPLDDLKLGLAAAVAKYPFLDGDRAAALGASYGGYMVNWIAGAWPDRFRALVTHDGNLDERFAYYATEELWFPEWEHGGTPWENPEGYAKHNPIELVKNWKTPILVVHGGQDFRVVETGGMATFTAAQRTGIPSRFLYFPDENHWVLKPANSILWHDTVLDWLDRWTK